MHSLNALICCLFDMKVVAILSIFLVQMCLVSKQCPRIQADGCDLNRRYTRMSE
jgi:hypothetical protein